MLGLSRTHNSSLRAFFVKQMQQLLVLCIICVVICFSLNKFTNGPPELLLESKKFPRKIWQSWKVDPTRFETRDVERARTWTVKNPGHRYEVLTDDNADYYVEHHYGPLGLNRPDIISVYKSLNAKIIKQDLLRYLIMYVEGGLYADIDVEAIRPIKRFIPKAYDEADVDMVIGIEVDEPAFASHPVLGPKAQSFCQWTFMCKPRLPVMMRLIENIMKWLHELARTQDKPISDLHLDFNEVLTGTGPSAFTLAILVEMSKTVGKNVAWDRFTDLTEAKLVGGILVLPVEAFAAGTGHSDSGNHKGKGAMVKHHFHASSWPTNHPRFKHPVYGEVEKCNWDAECVKLWDANTAFFNGLQEEERLRIINIKEQHISGASDHQAAANDAASDLQDPPAVGLLEDSPPVDMVAEKPPGGPAAKDPVMHADSAEAAAPGLQHPDTDLEESTQLMDSMLEGGQAKILANDVPIGPVEAAASEREDTLAMRSVDTEKDQADTADTMSWRELTPGLDL
ncbi:glycosyltransferase family 32 protein, partial [Aureobasidium melanogenum]